MYEKKNGKQRFFLFFFTLLIVICCGFFHLTNVLIVSHFRQKRLLNAPQCKC